MAAPSGMTNDRDSHVDPLHLVLLGARQHMYIVLGAVIVFAAGVALIQKATEPPLLTWLAFAVGTTAVVSVALGRWSRSEQVRRSDKR